jgi:hypothetical protein
MKVRPIVVFLASTLLVPVFQLQAGRGGGGGGRGGGMRPPAYYPPPAPAAPATNATAKAIQPGPNKFGDLPVSTTFYFLADTNKTYLWTKISSTSGSNTINKSVVPIKAPTVVNSN